MKKRCCIGIMLALSIMVVALPTTARAAEVFTLKGQDVRADFSSTDQCFFTDVSVIASEAKSHNPPGPGSAPSLVLVFISHFDSCTETSFFAVGSDSLEDQEFQTSKLDSATLSKSLEVFELFSQTSFQVDIDLTWSGTGPINRGNSHSHFQSEGCIINFHVNGTFRQAQASGSISDGATNFIPNPSSSAELSNSKQGRVDVNCEPE